MKFLKSLITSIFALALFMASALSVAGPPEHAKGNPPDRFYWSEEVGDPMTFEFPLAYCPAGFEAWMSITYQGFWMTFYNGRGEEQWENYHSATPVKIWNADDPTIYVESVPGSGVRRIWTAVAFDSDIIETGVQVMITLPGHGAIFRNVGRLYVNWFTGEAEFMAGQWDMWDEDFQALCAALTP